MAGKIRLSSPHRSGTYGLEVGDEVAVLFEDGDPERPIVLGAVWNGVQQAPRHGFFGAEEDIPENNVKRMVTKSGNRFQMVDTPGKETVLFATPNHTNITLTEKHDATGRTLVTVHSDGDIVLHAPEGRVHVKAKYFSREVGVAGEEVPAAPTTPLTLAAAPAPSLDGMSCTKKMEMALSSANWDAGVLAALGGPKGIAVMAGLLGGAAVIQAIPVAGEVEDVIAVIGGALAFAGLALSGHNVWQGLRDLARFKHACCSTAKTPGDLKQAGQLGANAVSEIGVNSLFAILSAKPILKGGKALPRVLGEKPPATSILGREPLSTAAEQRLPAIEQTKARYTLDPKLDPKWFDQEGKLRWPPDDGADGGWGSTRVTKGTVVDRYGLRSGKFFSRTGTSFGERSIATDPASADYHSFTVLEDFDVPSSRIAPWFDQPGGGEQFKWNAGIQDLVDKGFLKEN